MEQKSKQPEDRTDDIRYIRKRKIWGGISVAVLLALLVFLTIFLTNWFREFSDTSENFQAYIDSFGAYGMLVGLGIQMLQVVVALIPGEAVEIGLGYAFGALEGTLICYAGVAIASVLVFLLTKYFGVKLVEIFVSREKIDNLRFINSETKLERLIFILYLIPGTPKDLLTYFAGLTKIKLHRFLIISLLARFPSIISSTVGGGMLANGEIWQSIVLFAGVCVVSIAGMLLYNKIIASKNKKNAE